MQLRASTVATSLFTRKLRDTAATVYTIHGYTNAALHGDVREGCWLLYKLLSMLLLLLIATATAGVCSVLSAVATAGIVRHSQWQNEAHTNCSGAWHRLLLTATAMLDV
jgi:hypothetical protein